MKDGENHNTPEMAPQPGYWGILPACVRYARIPSSAKLLFSEISALQNAHGYCGAGNSYFTELYGVSERSLERWLEALKRVGFIAIDFKRFRDEKGQFKTSRRIWTLVDQYGNHRILPADKNVERPSEPADISVDRLLEDRATKMSNDKNVIEPPTFLSKCPDKNVGYNSTITNKNINKNCAPSAHVFAESEDSSKGEKFKSENPPESPSKSTPAPLPLDDHFARLKSPENCNEGHHSESSQPPEFAFAEELFPGSDATPRRLRREEHLEIIDHGLGLDQRAGGSIDERTINWPQEFKQINNLVRRGYSPGEIMDLLNRLYAARAKKEYYAINLPILPSRLSLRIIQNLSRMGAPGTVPVQGQADFEREQIEKARRRQEMIYDPTVLED